jgi:RNA polymerase sigma factor (sigma-70 family)
MYQQLSLPLFFNQSDEKKTLHKNNSTQTSKKALKMKEKSTHCIIVDELLDKEIKQSNVEKQAWKWTMDVDKWIWKQIRERRVPEQDWQDVYNLCVIEVFNLMKRYNPKYSKVSWANFGILKAFKEYESMNGTIRLPFHVLEKMATLRKFIVQKEYEGLKVTPEQMSEVTKMKITDLLVVRDRYAFIHSTDPEGNSTEFSGESLNIDRTCEDFVNSGELDPEESAIENDQMSFLYNNLSFLSDIEVYILTLRFGLDVDRIPKRSAFLKGAQYSLKDHVLGECLKFNDIGEKINITRERVRQIESRSIEKVRARIELEKRYES